VYHSSTKIKETFIKETETRKSYSAVPY